MKKLNEEVSLKGKIDLISMMDLRSSPGEVLNQVELGKTFIVTRRMKQVAIISKLVNEKKSIPKMPITICITNDFKQSPTADGSRKDPYDWSWFNKEYKNGVYQLEGARNWGSK